MPATQTYGSSKPLAELPVQVGGRVSAVQMEVSELKLCLMAEAAAASQWPTIDAASVVAMMNGSRWVIR